MSHVYRRPYPAYYWAPTNVEAQPIWEEPYCYREARPQELVYGNYEGPYWYYHQPREDGYYSYRPKYGDWDPRSYERNAKEFGGDFGRGFGRDLRPVYVYPPPPSASGPFAFRPFHPGDQFRHPDEYPMRFVPATYGLIPDPGEKHQVKPHCCGCPNHVCQLETRTMKGAEGKELKDENTEDVKMKTRNMQELAGPVVYFNPLEWHSKAPDNRNRNEGKAGHPVYWIPVNWNRNEGDKDQERWIPGNWIPLDMNCKPLGWGENKNELPGYWIPLDSSLGPQGLEEYKKRSQFEGNENKNKFPGYWIPLDSIARPEGEQKERENSLFEGKLHPFPVLWIPEESSKMTSSHEGMTNGCNENRPPFVLKFGNEYEKQRSEEASKEARARDVNVKQLGEGNSSMANLDEGTKNGGFEKEQKKINESAARPVIVQEAGKVNEKERTGEARKENKARDIPVKQLEEEKSAAEQKAKENILKIKARDIPVKQLEGENSAEVQKAKENVLEIKARDIPVKQLEKEKSSQAQVQKLEEKAAENHKASSPRASKLPPVCLRVDPLPGKKKTNSKSSSRSPSPRHKDNDLTTNASVQNTKSDAFKIPVESKKAEENASLKASKHAAETKKDDDAASSKSSKLGDETKRAEENASLKASQHAGETNKVDDAASSEASKLGDETKKAGENECLKNSMLDGELIKVKEDLNVQDKDGGITKTELSRDQAALKIQAMYRGYQVRKLQPLRKLREIAKIRHRMEELKQQIMNPEFEGELSRDDKTKTRMSESLMGLLLQLDTIQGLHPVVRDVRKSLARELVQLQEKLDKLVEEVRSSYLQPCICERENKMAAVQQKIDDRDKGLDATEDSCNTFLGISSENQEGRNETTKDENAQEKETVKQDSFEIENSVSNDGKENVFALKRAASKEEETGNTISNDKENVEDNAPVQEETLKVSGNWEIEIPSLSIQQNEETENQGENLSNERKPLVTSEEMISSVNEAMEAKAEKSEASLENISVEEKSEPNNLKEPDSAVSLVEKEICLDNSNILDENGTVSDKNVSLDQEGEVMPFELEAAPENQINTEKVEVSGFQSDKHGSSELEDALPEKTAGDSNEEFIIEASSQVVSDSLSVSQSDGLDETNLNKKEKALNMAENMRGEGDFAADMAKGSDNSVVEKATEALITGDEFSAMSNIKNDLHLQNGEHVSKCSRATDDIESVPADIVGTLVMDNSFNKHDLVHSENIHYSEPNISKSERNQDHDKWEEENEKLKEIVEKLVEAEKLQMSTIAQLNDKIKRLESKLGKGKRTTKARAGQLRLRSNRVGKEH